MRSTKEKALKAIIQAEESAAFTEILEKSWGNKNDP
jgi:hypothetical protein